MKKETEETQVRKDEELTEEELAKAAGGTDTLSGVPGKLAGGNSFENIGSEFANTVGIKR